MDRKHYHHGNLKASLIEAGIAVINREGLGALSLRKVAVLCNVSHSAPYSHFKNKTELLEAMRRYVSRQFVALFLDILKNNDKNNPEIIDKLGVAYVEFFIDNPQYFNFLFSKGNIRINLSPGDDKKDSFAAFQIFKDTAINIYKNLGMSQNQIENLIIIKWSVVHGLAAIATMQGTVYNKDWKSQIKELLCLKN